MELQLTKAKVILKEYLTRGDIRSIDSYLLKDQTYKINSTGQNNYDMVISVELALSAQDNQIIRCIDKIIENEKELKPTIEWLDNLSLNDYAELQIKANQLVEKEREAAKKLQKA